MTFLKMAAAAVLLTVSPMAAMAAEMPSAGQCEDWFAKVDSNNDGALGVQENAAEYSDLITKGSDASEASSQAIIITKATFLEACGKGTFGMPKN